MWAPVLMTVDFHTNRSIRVFGLLSVLPIADTRLLLQRGCRLIVYAFTPMVVRDRAGLGAPKARSDHIVQMTNKPKTRVCCFKGATLHVLKS